MSPVTKRFARHQPCAHAHSVRRHSLRAAVIALLWLAMLPLAATAAIPHGDSRIKLDIGGTAIEVETYKPPHYRDGALLLVFHGVNRNATGYRNYARPLADRFGFLVAAPRFERERFPNWRYAWGGMSRRIADESGGKAVIEPEAEWTGALINGLIADLRRTEQRPDMPYFLLGHSGGAQLLIRYAGFFSTQAQRIVIANPSSYLLPSLEFPFPYGYGGLPAPLAGDDRLRSLLAQPLTLLLGTADTTDYLLDKREPAMRQGANRHQRGLNAFEMAQALAREKGWTFNWRLVEVPGVGHSARQMFASPQAAAALEAQQ